MPGRSNYLDGLRGFAAVQVILLHYFTAFIPILAFPGPYLGGSRFANLMGGTPLYYIYDGNSAICTFFLLSGYVLTLSYLKKEAPLRSLFMGRTIRLGIPVSCSLVLAWMLFVLFPHQHQLAGNVLGSNWLTTLGDAGSNHVAHLQETFGGSMIIGYGDSSFWYFFPAIYNFLNPPSTAHSLNFPLWTLNIEFYGSLMIILICLLFKKSREVHMLWIVALLTYFQPYSITLFFVGHLFALFERRYPSERTLHPIVSLAGSFVGWILIASGVWMSTQGIASPKLAYYFQKVPLRLLEKSFGAVLIFASVLFFKRAGAIGRPLIWVFETRALQFLGKTSFSVYLLHVPVLFTVTSAIFVFLIQFETENAAIGMSIFAGIFLTYLAAIIFEKYVDQKALAISKARSANP